MEAYEPLLRTLRRGYAAFRTRRIIEASWLAAAVALPALLAAVLIGLILGPGRAAAWILPVIVACGLVGGLLRAIRFGARHHVSFGMFLLRIEARAGLQRNELVNALQLGRASSGMRDPLAIEIAMEVLRRGAETASKIEYRPLASVRKIRTPVIQATGALGVLLVLFLAAPRNVLMSAAEILHPGRALAVDQGRILITPGDCSAQRGASVVVRVLLTGISDDPFVFHRSGGSAWQRESMRPDSGGFAVTLADIQAPMEYAASAGKLRSRTYRISIEEPLRATGYEKRTKFPGYTGLAPERELSPHASIAALVGSEVELRVHLSRPGARGRLVFEAGRSIPLEAADPSVAVARMKVHDPAIFHVELEDPEIRGAAWRSEPFRCDPIPDRSPSIYLVSPGEQADLPSDMTIPLAVDCTDDFGITKCDLVWQRNNGPSTRRTIGRWTNEREARAEYQWDLEPVALSPGDRIAYHFELMDNDAVSGPKMTRSPEYSIRFPTVEQMYAQQEEEHQQGIEDLRNSLEKQIELRQELDKITRDTHRESGLQWEQKQEVQELLDKQEEILKRMESLSAGLDRQIQRMQQGQLFSPEIVAKIAQIQQMMEQIQNPEFHKMIEQLQRALQSLDPDSVKKALDQMKLSQKEIEQGLDRTLKMLERMLAEEKLDELIQRAERLREKQDEINQQLTRSNSGQRSDSTSTLSQEDAKNLQAQQEAARKELEELQKQMNELRERAKASNPQMSQKLEGSQGNQARQDLQQSSEDMDSGKQCMGRSNRSGALKMGRRTSKGLNSFAQQMRDMQSQMQQSMTEEMSRKLLDLAGELNDLSQNQEDTNDRSPRDNTRELALEQDRIARATSSVVDRIYDLARQTPFITPEQARTLGDAMNSLMSATDAYETGQRAAAVGLGRKAQTMMDATVASLLESNQNMCQSSSSSSCNKPNPFSQMQGLSSQQQGVNQESSQALSEMQGGQRMQESGQGRLERLAAQQEQIKSGLMDLSQSMGNQQDMLGRLDDLAKEMEDVAKAMRERHLDQRVIQRQEKILSRLLTAQRSLRRQDFEEQRRSRTGVDPANPVSPAAVQTGLSRREELRRGILKGAQDPIPGDFRRIVDEYFRAITEGDAR